MLLGKVPTLILAVKSSTPQFDIVDAPHKGLVSEFKQQWKRGETLYRAA
jgi:hypothetical protein